jgi:hypothetical protein
MIRWDVLLQVKYMGTYPTPGQVVMASSRRGHPAPGFAVRLVIAAGQRIRVDRWEILSRQIDLMAVEIHNSPTETIKTLIFLVRS